MRTLNSLILVGICAAVAHAQFGRGGADWMTAGGDAQRSSWIRVDPKISPENLAKPGFDFIWKVAVDPNARLAPAPPVLLNSYIGYRGFRSLAFVGGTGDKLVGIDTDLGRTEWRQQLPATSTGACGDATVAVARATTAAFPGQQAGFGGFGARRGPAKSDVGQPLEGAVTLKEVSANLTPPGGRGNAGRGPAGRGPTPPGFGRMPSVVNVITRDGMLHSIYVSNGEPQHPAVRFAPANTSLTGLIVVDNVAYATASQGCGAAPNEVLALDLESNHLAEFHVEGGTIVGSAGLAMGPDGTVYVSTTAGELLALEPKTLKLKNAYKAGQPFASAPVIIQHDDQAWIAASTKDGRIHLLDGTMASALATSNPIGSPAGSLATWQDSAGARWLLGTTASALVAWRVAQRNGAPAIEPGWTSGDLSTPLAPAIVNGVAFTASTGASPALYALDAATGKALWNSGRKIASAIRGGGLSAGNSQIYLGANDGALYVFGFPMEH
jgi:outer membrane protein assembly factor BamB